MFISITHESLGSNASPVLVDNAAITADPPTHIVPAFPANDVIVVLMQTVDAVVNWTAEPDVVTVILPVLIEVAT